MSDSSSYYETTYSEDERIETYLRMKKDQKKLEEEETDIRRKALFEEIYKSNKDKSESLFNQPGINFIRFNQKKIKFSFEPFKVVAYVSGRVIFWVSLRYIGKYWIIKRNTIPLPYKKKVYQQFHKGNELRTDENIIEWLSITYVYLRKWAEEEHKFRDEKFKRYQEGFEVELDTDDEEIFFTNIEKDELHSKREAILERMIPPPLRRRRRRRGQI